MSHLTLNWIHFPKLYPPWTVQIYTQFPSLPFIFFTYVTYLKASLRSPAARELNAPEYLLRFVENKRVTWLQSQSVTKFSDCSKQPDVNNYSRVSEPDAGVGKLYLANVADEYITAVTSRNHTTWIHVINCPSVATVPARSIRTAARSRKHDRSTLIFVPEACDLRDNRLSLYSPYNLSEIRGETIKENAWVIGKLENFWSNVSGRMSELT
jgi:hypothetical protein